MTRQDPDVVDVVVRALQLLQEFSAESPSLNVTEAATRIGTSRASARRLLLTLEREGFARHESGRFSLAPKVLRLGYGYMASVALWDFAMPYMKEVAQSLLEACSLSVLDEDSIVFVARASSARAVSPTPSVGSRMPAFATAMGRVLLAGLPPGELDAYFSCGTFPQLSPQTETRPDVLREEVKGVALRGWAGVDSESEAGIRSIAVPVFNDRGQITASLNVSANAARASLEQLKQEFLPTLKRVADQISGHPLEAVTFRMRQEGQKTS